MKTLVNFLLQFAGKNNSQSYKTISLAGGSIFFLVILPGIFIIIGLLLKNHIPIYCNRIIEITTAFIGIIAGLLLLIWAAVIQWKIGKGTPAPNAPTRHLITVGPYRHCRNPIELGAVLYYLGIGTLVGGIITGATGFILGFTAGSIYHKFIEEKELEKRFGEEYKKYRKNTPFIFPRPKIGKNRCT